MREGGSGRGLFGRLSALGQKWLESAYEGLSSRGCRFLMFGGEIGSWLGWP